MAFVPVLLPSLGLALKGVVAPLAAGAAVGTLAGNMVSNSYSRPNTFLQIPPIIGYINRPRPVTTPRPSSTTERVKKVSRLIPIIPPSDESFTEERNSTRDDDDECRKDDDHVSVSKHILYRLLRFIRFAGVIQRISVAADIVRGDVILNQASQYQDNSSHQSGYNIAHVIRVGRINSQIQNQHPNLYNELRNFTEYTQIVPVYASARYGLGGDLDRFQSRYFNQLATIDFGTSERTEEAQNILLQFRVAFINLLDQHIASDRYIPAEISGLECAKKEITDIKEVELFEEGRDGYNGRYSSNDQYPK